MEPSEWIRPGLVVSSMSDRLLRRCGHNYAGTTGDQRSSVAGVLHSSLALMRDLGGRDVTGLPPMYIGKSPMNSRGECITSWRYANTDADRLP